MLKEELLPLKRLNGTVEVATSRLFATQGLDALKTMTGLNLKPVLASSEAIQREIKKRLGVGADTIGTLDEEKGFQVVDENAEDTNLDEAAEDEASIIRFVNQVLKDAIELRASDIHLEPFEDEFRIRYRIDGVLQDVPVPAQLKRFQPAIVSRVKILSHLNIAEKRLPQDGRIKIRIDDAEVDIRVSVIPMLHGEAVVMRLLRQNSTLRGMGELGMDTRELDCFQRVLQLPHGIILVTGPTGSGKTSTLYTALNEINDAVRKIITIEDPVEYQLKGVNQIQVNEKVRPDLRARAALDFAPRPGRDSDRRNSRPGNGADRRAGVADRPPGFLHAAHQRRARRADAAGGHGRRAVSGRLVARSRAGATPRPRALPALQAAGQFADRAGVQGASSAFPANTTIYKSVGCRECRNTGFFGRHAIFEWMDTDNEIRQLILKNASTDQIRDAARRARHAHAGRGRLAAGAPGHHDGRGSFERDDRQGSRAHANQAENARASRRRGNMNRRPKPKPTSDAERCAAFDVRRWTWISILTCPRFPIQSVAGRRHDGRGPARRRRAGPTRFAQMEALGLRPVNLAEKAGAEAGQKRFGARRLRWLGMLSVQVRIATRFPAKELENFTRLLSSLLAAGVPLSRALVILHKEASVAGRAGEVEGNPRPGRGRHVAGRRDGANRRRRFRASMSRWWRRARRAGFSTWCWRRSRTFSRAKRS